MSTDFLFAQPSFIKGMGQVLDIGATMTTYNDSKSTQEADARAMHSDWSMIGNDIKNAMSLFGVKHAKNKTQATR